MNLLEQQRYFHEVVVPAARAYAREHPEEFPMDGIEECFMQGADIVARKPIETEIAEYLAAKVEAKRKQLDEFPEDAEQRAKLRNEIEALETARTILFA